MIKSRNTNLGFHLLALITIIIWGTTFVSTKILIRCNLSAIDIFFYRFLIAYLCILAIAPKKLLSNNLKDETVFLLLGLTGGSLYFLAENSALYFTLASNVALIICTTPIITAWVAHCFYKKEKLKTRFLVGSMVALSGVALVVFNGSFILQMNPLGDLLTLIAAVSWAFYCLFLKRMNSRYSVLFITRKVFFYGLITITPILLFHPLEFNINILCQPIVFGNLLFLGILASMICYIIWTAVINHLGMVCATNYIYIIPLVTLLTSSIILGEHITIVALVGSAFILLGVYLAGK